MWYDAVTALILILATVRGAVKGFVWQVASIAAIVLCFAFASPLSEKLAPHIGIQPPLNRWVAMFVLYALLALVCFGLARVLRDMLEKAKFVEYDRHLGSVFGFVKGAVCCVLLTFFSVTLFESIQPTVLGSYSGYAAAVILHKLQPVMPDEFDRIVTPYLERFDRSLAHGGVQQAGVDPTRPAVDPVGPLPGSTTPADPFATPLWPADPLPPRPGEPFRGVGGNDPFEPGPSTATPSANSSLEELVKRIPGALDADLRQLALRALENTRPEDRGELLQKLQTGIPGMIRLAATDWQSGRPAIAGTGGTRRSQLLAEIATIYADFPEAQSDFTAEIEHQLSGLPDRVSAAAIEDWYADVLAQDVDPDPGTSLTTSLDTRIVRQLASANVSLSTLSATLQQRLRESQLR